MSFFQELENMKYHYVIDIIKNDEQYDKKRNVLSAKEAFKLGYNRYLLMKQILLPLIEKIGDIVITNIIFSNGMDECMTMELKYLKGDKEHTLTITNMDDQDISVMSSDEMIHDIAFADANRKIILDVFKGISDNFLDEDFVIKSTTGRFIIKNDCNVFSIQDVDKKMFSLDIKFCEYEKSEVLPKPINLVCNYPKLRELFIDENSKLATYEHLKIYEDTLPRQLKKLTNR